MTARALLFVRVPPVPAAIEPEWTRWYDHEHIAYRLDKPGFLGARRYRVDGGPLAHLALYELEDPSALASDAYLAHRRWEEAQVAPRFEAIAPRMPGFRRGVYLHATPRSRRYAVPDRTALLVVDLDGADALGDDAACDALLARVDAVEGVGASRILTLAPSASPGSGQHTGGPARLAMIDTREITPSLVDAVGGAWTSRTRPDIRSVSMLARRAYSSFHPSGA